MYQFTFEWAGSNKDYFSSVSQLLAVISFSLSKTQNPSQCASLAWTFLAISRKLCHLRILNWRGKNKILFLEFLYDGVTGTRIIFSLYQPIYQKKYGKQLSTMFRHLKKKGSSGLNSKRKKTIDVSSISITVSF